MKIAMLGHEGAGKTSYVAAMYATMTAGVGGFRVRARDTAVHEQLLRSARSLRDGRYPPASDARNAYDLVLCHGSEDVADFAWLDYRGGALMGLSTDTQVGELTADLTAADGIVVFADSSDLFAGGEAGDRIARISLLVTNALGGTERPTPVVFVLTKVDMVVGRAGPAALVEPLLPLMEAVARSRKLFGALVPVSCGAQSLNLALPVLWCLRIGLVNDVLATMAKAADLAAQEADLRRRATVGDWFTSRWNGWPTNGELADRRVRDRAAALQRLAPLIENVGGLHKLIEAAGLLTF